MPACEQLCVRDCRGTRSENEAIAEPRKARRQLVAGTSYTPTSSPVYSFLIMLIIILACGKVKVTFCFCSSGITKLPNWLSKYASFEITFELLRRKLSVSYFMLSKTCCSNVSLGIIGGGFSLRRLWIRINFGSPLYLLQRVWSF